MSEQAQGIVEALRQEVWLTDLFEESTMLADLSDNLGAVEFELQKSYAGPDAEKLLRQIRDTRYALSDAYIQIDTLYNMVPSPDDGQGEEEEE